MSDSKMFKFELDEDSGPDRISGKLIMDTAMFVGKSAGQLRAIGIELPDEIPDCAVCDLVGSFNWVALNLVITKDGVEEAE